MTINLKCDSAFWRAFVATLVLALCLSVGGPSHAVHPETAIATTIAPHEWAQYRQRFVAPSGRVIDHEKRGVSHSESQGYGMFLAVAADDQATFKRIARFTLTEMRRRRDNLTSWLYDPAHPQRIADHNNATDGDIMIAYSLLLAALKWDEPRYVKVAQPIVADIGRLLLRRKGDEVYVRPAAFGFDAEHVDGPVLNLSYYIFGAFLMFDAFDETHPWQEAWHSGLRLVERTLRKTGGVAPDWVTLNSRRYLTPASGFKKHSSYDAVRIPLYMAVHGRVPARHFAAFDTLWNIHASQAPLDYDIKNRKVAMQMNDPGYRAIAALAACAHRGVPIPAPLQRYRNGTYFASSLHLMALVAARAHYPHCVDTSPVRSVVIATSTVPSGAAEPSRTHSRSARHFRMN